MSGMNVVYNDPRPLVVIVTVNWNHPQDTIDCLKSLEALTYKTRRVVVVDNGSEDDSPVKIRSAMPDVEVIENECNLGFAAGINIGIARGVELGADYVLLLNNDTIVAPNLLEPLIETCEADAQIGIVGPKVYYFGTRQVFSAGGWPRRCLPLLVRQPHPVGLEQASESTDLPQELGYIWGQAMLIRRQVLEQVGLFDADFFMYYEDCDLCLRAARSGFRLMVVPQAHIWHKVAQSTRGNEWGRWQYQIASMFHFYLKYARMGKPQAALQTFLTLVGIGVEELLRGNWRWMAYPFSRFKSRR